MRRILALLPAVIVMNVAPAPSVSADQHTLNVPRATALMQVMADGIGDLSFASPEWVEAAQEALGELAQQHAEGLNDVKFTLCEVGHNPPAYLHVGGKVAWYCRFDGAKVTAAGATRSAIRPSCLTPSPSPPTTSRASCPASALVDRKCMSPSLARTS